MALSILLGLQPSPLGCMVNCDFVSWHFRSFRFDAAQEPAQPGVPFIDAHLLQPGDCIVELRSCEAPASVAERVERVLPHELDAAATGGSPHRTGLRQRHPRGAGGQRAGAARL